MNQPGYFNRLSACALAVMLGATSPLILADESKTTPQPGNQGWGPCPMGGYGMGPGMMGGYGMGPGMMGGYGMGQGMMGGYGMGPGMMGGYDWGNNLNLSDDQRTKINRIQDETRKTQWTLMGAMMDQQARLRDLYESPKQDTAAIDKAYKAIGKLHQQMYDNGVDAQKRMDAVLTKEQQEKLRSNWRKGGTTGN